MSAMHLMYDRLQEFERKDTMYDKPQTREFLEELSAELDMESDVV